MARYYGSPRRLTDAQVEQVMARNARRLEFKEIHGTIYELAHRLGAGVRDVIYCIRHRAKYLAQPEIVALMSGQPRTSSSLRLRRRGNPGKLTDAQRATVLTWYSAYVQSGCERGSTKRFIRELGISGYTYHKCIRNKGVYKQDHRETLPTKVKRPKKRTGRYRLSRLPRGYLETRMRIAAMRAWKRTTGTENKLSRK